MRIALLFIAALYVIGPVCPLFGQEAEEALWTVPGETAVQELRPVVEAQPIANSSAGSVHIVSQTAAQRVSDSDGARPAVARFGTVRGPGYSAVWYPTTPVTDQATDLGLVRQSIRIGAPLWKREGDLALLSLKLEHSLFFTEAILPDTGRDFPDELWNINFGLNHLHTFDNGWKSGLITTFGSASDRPFHSFDEIRFGAIGFLEVSARRDPDSWKFSIFYMPFSDLPFPIPGLAYVWHASDELVVDLGIPFALNWTPTDDFMISISYTPLYNVDALMKYLLTEDVQLYGGFETVRESYYLSDRPDSSDRFLSSEQRVIGGVRFDIRRNAVLDLNAGYAFGRFYGEGGNDRASVDDLVQVGDGAFLGGSLTVRF